MIWTQDPRTTRGLQATHTEAPSHWDDPAFADDAAPVVAVTWFEAAAYAAWLAAESMWDDAQLDEQCRAWGREALADLAPFASDGRYVNDVAEVGADVARTVYGDAKYDRLVALKREWDPENVFRLNQNVQP